MCDDFKRRIEDIKTYVREHRHIAKKERADEWVYLVAIVRKYIILNMSKSMQTSSNLFRTARSWVGFYAWTYVNSQLQGAESAFSHVTHLAMKSLLVNRQNEEGVELPDLDTAFAVRMYRNSCDRNGFEARELRKRTDDQSKVERLMFNLLAHSM